MIAANKVPNKAGRASVGPACLRLSCWEAEANQHLLKPANHGGQRNAGGSAARVSVNQAASRTRSGPGDWAKGDTAAADWLINQVASLVEAQLVDSLSSRNGLSRGDAVYGAQQAATLGQGDCVRGRSRSGKLGRRNDAVNIRGNSLARDRQNVRGRSRSGNRDFDSGGR